MSGAVLQVIGYALEAPAPPFPVFVLGYMINGFGLALQVSTHAYYRGGATANATLSALKNAGSNGYVAALKENTATKFGILHAIYGMSPFRAPSNNSRDSDQGDISRCRRVFLPPHRDTVRAAQSLVLPLSCSARHRTLQHILPDRGVPLQRPRQSVSSTLHFVPLVYAHAVP